MESVPLDLLPYNALSSLRGVNRYFRDMASDETLGLNRMEELVNHFRSLNRPNAASRIYDVPVEDIWGMLSHLAGGEMLFPAFVEANLLVSGYLSADDGGSMSFDTEIYFPDGMHVLRGNKLSGGSLDEMYDRIRLAINTLVRDRWAIPSFTEFEFEWTLSGLRFLVIDPVHRQVFESNASVMSSSSQDVDTDLVLIRLDAEAYDIIVTLVKRMMDIWY